MALLFGYSSGLTTIEDDINMFRSSIYLRQHQTLNPLRKATLTHATREEVVDKDLKVKRVILDLKGTPDRKDLKETRVILDCKVLRDLRVTPVHEVRRETPDRKV